MVNKVTLIGNLGNVPEFRTLENGTAVARISLATNERWQDKAGEWQTHTDWHNVVCWRELAERAVANLKKGMLVYVEGKISYRKYPDKEGIERYATDIVASTVRRLEKVDSDHDARSFPSEPPAERGKPTAPQSTSPDSGAAAVPAGSGANDLPF